MLSDKLPPSVTLESASPVVVAIGASAGGLEALEQFFRAVPAHTGLAFVVIQHLSPDFKSLMDELLARQTRLPIVRLVAPTNPEPNTIYLVPPGRELRYRDGLLTPAPRTPEDGVHLPINRFFSSLAEARGADAVAIVLSGTGTDGSHGAVAVRDAGGLVLAQSEETAKFGGMPRSALQTGAVHHALPPDDLATLLAQHTGDLGALRQRTAPVGLGDYALGPLFRLLRDTHGVDFALYKPGTIRRRIERRATLSGRWTDVDEYIASLADDPLELDGLYRDLLIGVTAFFRDPDVFDTLRDKAIPGLVQEAPPNEDLRVWVPGCSTGQEAYTLAMLLLDGMDRVGATMGLKVFATDIHPDALRVASEGIYLPEEVAPIPSELRDKNFVLEPDGRYRVRPRLRRTVMFSIHNLLKDVPFNRMDLVSCRNLLIYIDPVGQRRAGAALLFALRRGGVLLMGPSESIGDVEADCEPIDRSARLLRKTTDQRPTLATTLQRLGPPERVATLAEPRLKRVYERLLDRYVPTSVLVDHRREVLHVFGNANAYLRPAAGRASMDVVNMCEGELRIALSTALLGASRRQGAVVTHNIRVSEREDAPRVDVTVEPIEEGGTGGRFFLIHFADPALRTVPAPTEAVEDHVVLTQDERARMRLMEVDLSEARDALQALTEEFEATHEELQASNEELVTGNEELQSTNEELQSLNEELYTVNAEHERKINELAAATGDLRNVMAVSQAGIVFTNAANVVRMFTPGATQVLNLLPQDVGRPIDHITSRMEHDDLLEELQRVKRTQEVAERTLQLADGRHLARRIVPYHGLDGVADGCIITFADVSAHVRAEHAEAGRAALLHAVIDATPSHVAVLDRAGVIVATNAAWDAFGEQNGGDPGRNGVGADYLAACATGVGTAADAGALVREVVTGARARADLDYPCHSPEEERWFWMTAAAIAEPHGGAIVVHTDITVRKRAERFDRRLQESARLESLGVLAGGVAHDFNNILTGILAGVELCKLDAAPGSETADALVDVEHSALRATQLCAQMLAFSGRGHFSVEPQVLGWVVEDTMALVHASVPKNATIEVEALPEIGKADMDATQVRQVIMNLVINAAEALEGRAGTVRVTTGSGVPVVAPGEVEVVPPQYPGMPHSFVSVSDEGCGIAASTLLHIFDPFFTTKFTGRGLGLAAVQGIVRGHRGALFVRSTLGEGTTFRVYLPTNQAPAPAVRPAPEHIVPHAPTGQTLLVIDDEPILRRALGRLLERFGYGVVAAATGAEGVEAWRQAPQRFAAVLLDLTMPGMSGADTLRALRALAPDVKVLLMSGYSEDEVAPPFAADPPAGFLQKPMTAEVLLPAIAGLFTRGQET